MSNTLHYSSLALQDISDIYNYINTEKQNPIAAKNTIQGIKSAISELKTLDNIGTKVILPTDIETKYRFIQYKNYLIFYYSDKTEIYISRILYARRDYLNILF